MRRIPHSLRWMALVAACAIALLVTNAARANTLAIIPTPTRAFTSATLHFEAIGGTAAGYTWSLAVNASGATISTAGLYTAGRLGGVTDVVALQDSGGNTATASVSVLSTLAITAPSSTIAIGQSLAFSASGGSGVGFVWSLASAPSGATITALGAYVAGHSGEVTDVIRVLDSAGNAATFGVAVTSGLTINPDSPSIVAGATEAFVASGGSGIGYTWSLPNNESGATLNTFGVYTAGVRAGTTDVVAVTDAYGNTKSTNIAVQAIAITPSGPKVSIHTSQAFVASGGSGAGYAWSLASNASGGSIDTIGIYKAGPLGEVTDVVQVTDSAGNVSTARISVASGLTVKPSSTNVASAATVAFVAAGGNGVYAWSLASSVSGGSITGFGLYTAGPLGGATDIAQVVDSAGNIATAQITISGGALIRPASPSVPVRTSLGFVASGGSGTGYTWSLTKNTSGATLNDFGVYTAGPLGDVTDTIELLDSAGRRSTTAINVVSGLAISPSTPSVVQGTSLGLVATGGSGAGYTWTLEKNISGAALTDFGVYTAGAPDAAATTTDVVRVTDSDGNTVTSNITVIPPPIDAGAAPGGVAFGASGEDNPSSGCAAAGPSAPAGWAFGALVVLSALIVQRRRRGRPSP